MIIDELLTVTKLVGFFTSERMKEKFDKDENDTALFMNLIEREGLYFDINKLELLLYSEIPLFKEDFIKFINGTILSYDLKNEKVIATLHLCVDISVLISFHNIYLKYTKDQLNSTLMILCDEEQLTNRVIWYNTLCKRYANLYRKWFSSLTSLELQALIATRL